MGVEKTARAEEGKGGVIRSYHGEVQHDEPRPAAVEQKVFEVHREPPIRDDPEQDCHEEVGEDEAGRDDPGFHLQSSSSCPDENHDEGDVDDEQVGV